MLVDQSQGDARGRDLPNPVGQFQQAIDEFEEWLVGAADRRPVGPYLQWDPAGVTGNQVGRGASGYLPPCGDEG